MRVASMRVVSHGETGTERIAARVARTLRGGEVLLLEGDLGAGKTVFVRGLARALGVRGRITSPTFVLVREYKAASRQLQAASRRKHIQSGHLEACSCRLVAFFIHADAYRVRDPHELLHAGLGEWIGRPDAVVAVEWGERLVPLLRGVRTIRIRFAQGRTPDERRIAMVHTRRGRRAKNVTI